jgi:hypothetical protein
VTVTSTPTDEDFRATADRLALRVADLVRERDIAIGECIDAQATAHRFRDERDRERQRADSAEAAGVDMAATIADGIRREEALAADLRKSRAEVQGLARICRRLQDALDEEARAHRRDSDEVVRLVTELSALDELRRQVDAARAKRRMPGVRRRDR